MIGSNTENSVKSSVADFIAHINFFAELHLSIW